MSEQFDEAAVAGENCANDEVTRKHAVEVDGEFDALGREAIIDFLDLDDVLAGGKNIALKLAFLENDGDDFLS